MPANVSIEFLKAKKKFEEAKTDIEKLIALQEMKAKAPSHKGAENLRADITKKIAQLKKQMEKKRETAKKRASFSINVKKEGAGQIVLIGLPNSGKSHLLNKLTNATVEEGMYAFTTKLPQQGMMNFKGALVQLVEVPAIIEGSSEGKANGIQLLSIIRNADAIVLVLNAKNALKEFSILKNELFKAKIFLNQSKPLIEVKHSKFKGITVSGKKFLKISMNELTGFLKSMGFTNASVILNEKTNLNKLAQVLDESIVYKKALAVINQGQKLVDLNGFPVILFEEKKLEKIKEKIFSLLNKILIDTKKPGKKPDLKEPLVLRKNATIEEVAKHLHKDFAKQLKGVRVWGSTKFPGQKVGKYYELKNEDIVEILI